MEAAEPQEEPPPSRRRCALALVMVIALGLGSRSGHPLVPGFLAVYAGDALWAVCAYLGVCLLVPAASAGKVAVAAAGIALTVELSQLYHAPWIDSIRETRPGGLLLGWGFLWSDLCCYAVGVALAYALDPVLRAPASRAKR